MKYKYIIARYICAAALICGVGCVVAVSHVKSAEPAAVQYKNELDGQSVDLAEGASLLQEQTEPEKHDVYYDGTMAAPSNDIFVGAGIQFIFNGTIPEIQLDEGESIVAFNEDVLSAGEDDIIDVSEEESEYADLAIANVKKYVNVRTQPSTEGSIVGKIYNGAVAQILAVEDGEDGDWFQIVSGEVEGYIKAEFFIYGDAAVAVIDDYFTRYANVLANRLNVRK